MVFLDRCSRDFGETEIKFRASSYAHFSKYRRGVTTTSSRSNWLGMALTFKFSVAGFSHHLDIGTVTELL